MRYLHLSAVSKNQKTDEEELIIFGGLTRIVRPVEMIPFALNLKTLEWREGSGLDVPEPRHRSCVCKVIV